MDSASAFAMGDLNRGKPLMVFDWDKAARLIKEKKPNVASAGLRSDWEWTGGTIYEDGHIVATCYTYLASTWATPEIDLDGEVLPCYIMQDQTEWGSDTKWPEPAKAILNG